MPKVNLSRESPVNETAKAIYTYFQAMVGTQRLLKLMGYGSTTHCQRKKHPENLTLEQLRVIYRSAHLSDEEFMKMIRADKDRNESRF